MCDLKSLHSALQKPFRLKCGRRLTNFAGRRGTLGFAVLLSFLCIILVNKILHCGIAVIPNPTVCDVCAFKPTVFSETKLVAVLRHQQYQHSLQVDHEVWMVYMPDCLENI